MWSNAIIFIHEIAFENIYKMSVTLSTVYGRLRPSTGTVLHVYMVDSLVSSDAELTWIMEHEQMWS